MGIKQTNSITVRPGEGIRPEVWERVFGSDINRRKRVQRRKREQERRKREGDEMLLRKCDPVVIDRDRGFGSKGIYSLPLDKVIRNSAHQREIEATTDFRFHCLH